MAELPPLNALRTFLFAAETQSFKKAAERLFVTQAAVSHQIRLLEDALDTQLFIRLNREVKLTEEGERLLPFVRSAFRSLKAGVDQLKGDPAPNKLTLSVLPSFASSWLVYHIGEFQDRYPDIHLVIRPSLELEAFNTSEVDLAIRFGEGRYEHLQTEFLMRDAMMAVCTPEMVVEAPLTFAKLKTLPLLEDFSPGGVGWLTWLTEQHLDPDDYRISLTIQDARLVIDAVLQGKGVGLVRKSLCQHLVEQGELVKAFDYELPSSFSYYLVAPSANFEKPKVRLFADWLRQELETSFLPEHFAYYGS